MDPISVNWYWLGTLDDRLRDLYGFQAKQLGKSLPRQQDLHNVVFQSRVCKAMKIKLEGAPPHIIKAFYESELPFEHYYVYGGTVRDAGFKWIAEYWIKLRDEREFVMSDKKEFRVVVAGSRTFTDYELLKNKLLTLLTHKSMRHTVIIVSGGARGADQLGERFAKEFNTPIEQFIPDWDGLGKSAGYRRNEQMAEAADAVVVFMQSGGSKGSQHMINIAIEKGLPVRVITF